MSEGKVDLDELCISSPCPVKWDEMPGTERLRFCSLCKLNVHNISEMTRKDAEALLEQKEGSEICLRVYRRQDGTIITKDCGLRRRLAQALKQRVRMVAAAVISLLNACPAFGQAQNAMSKDTTTKSRESMFQVEPTVIDGRRYTSGRPERHQKTITPVPEDPYVAGSNQALITLDVTGTLLPKNAVGDVLSQPDDRALLAYLEAQSYEVWPDNAGSLAAYGEAIGIIRTFRHDPKFAQMVARKYAKLLRKTGNVPQAMLIEVEFKVADSPATD